MKRIILVLVAILVGIWFEASAQQPFYRPTKHKLMKHMTRHQVKKANKNKTLYVRHHGKMKKNR
jgi:hypothetical protein